MWGSVEGKREEIHEKEESISGGQVTRRCHHLMGRLRIKGKKLVSKGERKREEGVYINPIRSRLRGAKHNVGGTWEGLSIGWWKEVGKGKRTTTAVDEVVSGDRAFN